MTQVSLNVSGQTVGSFTTTYQMSDEEGARIIMAYGKIYGPVDDGEGGQRPMTPAEIVDKIASGFLAGVLQNTKRQEQADAAAAAAAQVPDIVPMPLP